MPASRRRLRAALVAGAVAAAVLVGTPALADVVPTPLQPAAVTAPTVRPAAERTATRLHGWAAAPKRVRVQQRFAVRVRVSGGRRIVRLERLLHGEWHRVDRVRTSPAGRAVLRWQAATAAQHVVLRVRVPATATRTGVRSSAHDLRIVRPAAAPRATTAATPAPTASPVATPAPAATAAPAPTATPAPVPTPTLTAPTPAPVPSSTAAAAEAARLDALREPVRARLLVLVNEARATARTCGDQQYPAVPALGRSTALDAAAQGWSDQMAFHDFFAHESGGSTMVTRLNAAGISSGTMRENIAAGQRTAETVMAGWLDSPGHCANLMAADVTTIGFGHTTATDSHYGDYWVQDLAG